MLNKVCGEISVGFFWGGGEPGRVFIVEDAYQVALLVVASLGIYLEWN